MANLSPEQILQNKIDGAKIVQKRRPYLGMSGLGQECAARIWFTFRWASPPEVIDARKARIFDRGNIEEARVIAKLKDAGLECFIVDHETGEEKEMFGTPDEEQEEMVGFAGHALGHNDGRVRGVPTIEKETLLLEIKTMSASSFRKLCKIGLYAYSKTYFGQCQRYMKALDLKKSLFIAVNKDTEHWKILIVEYDEGYAEDLVRKEEILVTTEQRPPPHYKMGFWKCDWCPHNLVCHLGEAPEANCRTCENVVVTDNGVWECGLTNKALSYEDQEKGCQHYKRLF